MKDLKLITISGPTINIRFRHQKKQPHFHEADKHYSLSKQYQANCLN